MHNEHTKNRGMSFKSILKRFLSVARIAISRGIMAIENLRNSNVVGSIPFCVSVLTNIPLDPNIIPASIGKIKYIFFIASFQIRVCIPCDGIIFTRIVQGNFQIVNQLHFVITRVNMICGFV